MLCSKDCSWLLNNRVDECQIHSALHHGLIISCTKKRRFMISCKESVWTHQCINMLLSYTYIILKSLTIYENKMLWYSERNQSLFLQLLSKYGSTSVNKVNFSHVSGHRIHSTILVATKFKCSIGKELIFLNRGTTVLWNFYSCGFFINTQFLYTM